MSGHGNHTRRTKLIELLHRQEIGLMERVLYYAREYQFTRYTSTLAEAWRLSVQGLTQTLSEFTILHPDIPQMKPSDHDLNSPSMRFCIEIVRSHRQRGIPIELFLGLFKYYRRAYKECLMESTLETETQEWCCSYLEGYFDQMEIMISSAWHDTTADEKIQALEAYSRNITNEKNKYLALFGSLPQPVFILDESNLINHMNDAAIHLYKSQSLPGDAYYHSYHVGESLSWIQKELEQMHSENKQYMEFEKQFPNHQNQVWYECKLTRMQDVTHQFLGIMLVLNDITLRKHSEETLRNLSVEDDLTGLFNRRGFLWLAHRQLKLCRRMNKRAVLFYMDIDYLKKVNDEYGHPEGDRYLKAFAQLLKEVFRESDIIGRIGGDEFLVLAVDVNDGCESLLQSRLMEKIQEYNIQSHLPLPLSASLGISFYSNQTDLTIEELIAEADSRMYEVKKNRRNSLNIVR